MHLWSGRRAVPCKDSPVRAERHTSIVLSDDFGVCTGPDQIQFTGATNGLYAAANMELAIQMLYMPLHSSDRDIQLLGDLLVCAAIHDELKNLMLAQGQLFDQAFIRLSTLKSGGAAKGGRHFERISIAVEWILGGCLADHRVDVIRNMRRKDW